MNHSRLPGNITIKQVGDSGDLAAALVDHISETIASAIRDNGKAGLAVSGGRSPIPVFQRLAETGLDWSKVTVTLVDERWVAPDHDDSNEKLVRDHLLKHKAAEARFIPMKNPADSPEAGQAECGLILTEMPLPMDVVLLGMGEDGHTASLFPNRPELAQALDLSNEEMCIATHPNGAPHARMSLTLHALLQSRLLLLPLAGEGKLATFDKACEDGPVEDMPVRAVLRQDQVPVEVWLAN